MKKYSRFREILGVILIFGAWIVAIVSGFISVVMRFQYPDLTSIRWLLNNPWTWKVAIGCVILYMVGYGLLEK